MQAVTELLEFAKDIIIQTATQFLNYQEKNLKTISHRELEGKEIKLLADQFLNDKLLTRLIETKINILSEESGVVKHNDDSLTWILDPLDGSVNFLRGVGPSAISLALWKGNTPLLGIIYNLSEKFLLWGGKNLGAFKEGQQIRVSQCDDIKKALLCTGFPVRFRKEKSAALDNYIDKISGFEKIRMFGSAAASLSKVACGEADAYLEDKIMIWDVAAGLALVEGAGGFFRAKETEIPFAYNVIAGSNLLENGIW